MLRRLIESGLEHTNKSGDIDQYRLWVLLKNHYKFLTYQGFQDPESLEIEPPPNAFTIDENSRTITINGKVVFLAQKEFLLINILNQHANQAVNYQEIFAEIWPGKNVDRNAADQLMYRTRQKIEPVYDSSYLIKTIRNIGYLLDLTDFSS